MDRPDTSRPAAAYVFAAGTVSIPFRIAALLERFAGVEELRLRAQRADPELYQVLIAIHIGAEQWRRAASGTKQAPVPELAGGLGEWMSTSEAAALLGIGDRAVRKSISSGHLPAESVAGRWRISREDISHYLAARHAA